MRPAFWQGRRVLLTGHTGFKGAWLALWLKRLGADVAGLSLDPQTEPSLFNLAAVADDLRDVRGNINNAATVRAALDEHEPQVVFHLAAQALVRASYADPLGTCATNVMGTLHVLEAIRHRNKPCVLVNVTSDKCYRNTERQAAYSESDCLGGNDVYSGSKAAAEVLTASWRRSFFAPCPEKGIRVATARAGNVLGGGDYAADRLVPDCVRAFQQDRAVQIRSPQSVRPWQFVLDPLEGYLRLAEALDLHGDSFADAWNFGPPGDDARTVQWTVDRAATLWGDGAAWQADAGPHPREAHRLTIDPRKATDKLGWRMRLEPEETMQWTMDWYRRLRDGHMARDLCLEQIERFENLQGVCQ